MKAALAYTLGLALAACAAPQAKKESSIVEGSEVPESCCCKSSPLASEDGKPIYATSNRMECSGIQGECVPDVQCDKTDGSDKGNAPGGKPDGQ